jgi:nitroimidazol reductase NimA-like FMN-containing flavoprotein (pyridoxamine 5'-phosphate oxidase superfamily)
MMENQEHKLRRKDRAADEAEAETILREGVYGVLSLVDAAGEAYGVPLSYAYAAGAIHVHSAVEGHKLEGLRTGAIVSFCVVGQAEPIPEKFSMRYRSAIARCEVHELDGEEKLASLEQLVAKYAAQLRPEGTAYIAELKGSTRVFALCVLTVSGKRRK